MGYNIMTYKRVKENGKGLNWFKSQGQISDSSY